MAAANIPQAANQPEEKEVKKTSFKLAKNGMVRITHPKLKDQVGEVVPSSLPAWLGRGWTVADPTEGDEKNFVVVLDEEKRTGEVVPETEKK